MSRFAFSFVIMVFGCVLLAWKAHAMEKLSVTQVAPNVYVAYGSIAQVNTENRGFNGNAHPVYLEEQKKLLFGK